MRCLCERKCGKGEAVRHLSNLLDFIAENHTIHVFRRLIQKYIPVPDCQNIQIIIDIQIVLRNLLDRFDDLVYLHVIDVLHQRDGFFLNLFKLLAADAGGTAGLRGHSDPYLQRGGTPAYDYKPLRGTQYEAGVGCACKKISDVTLASSLLFACCSAFTIVSIPS